MCDEVIIKAIDYIKEHLEEELTVEAIADHCHFSKYYFNRLFKSVVGESVYAFIKRLKIEKSASQITREVDKSITQVSARYGYSSSNYSTAFKKHYGESPVLFRRKQNNDKIVSLSNGFFADLSKRDFDYYNSKMKRVQLDDTLVIYQRFIGNYRNLSYYWSEFLAKYKQYCTKDSLQLEITYDDPVFTEGNRCITDICMTTTRKIPNDCNTTILKGGTNMVYNFKGEMQKIFQVFQGLLSIWIVETPYEVDFEARKLITKYNVVDIDNNYFDIDIYIPIK